MPVDVDLQQPIASTMDGSLAHPLGNFSPSFSGSGSLQTLASLNHPANEIGFRLQAVAKADHKILLQSGNDTYVNLLHELATAKGMVEAQR